MAGLISKESIEEVRSRARLEEIVSQFVQLKAGGADSLKGLCPFHDEKTPSFHVRPAAGYYHCFGCDESGDAIKFVMEMEHLSFVEAVEYLANLTGVQLRYEEGRRERPEQQGVSKSRLIDAHRVAVDFYMAQLHSEGGKAALDYLHGRGFNDDAVAQYSIGYSPDSWDALCGHLRGRGFSDEVILAAGLASKGTRGLYDRFRGRIMWPIFSTTGDPIGFGARKLNDEAEGPKYLNTSETPIYRKSHVLYGLNLAKKAIAAERKVVIVEGYTDVMAAHLAGIPYAVATCGTAFGKDHITIVRRLMGDAQNPAAGVMLASGQAYGGEVIFTFDGDEAGQKAAMRAFEEDQSFAAQTFVCVAPNGQDPCEVRLAQGDEAVRQLIESRKPLFEFAIRSTLKGIPLSTVEGRAAGLRATAPVVARIRDRVVRHEYTRQLAHWLGMDEAMVKQAVRDCGRMPSGRGQASATASEEGSLPASSLVPLHLLRDPTQRLEREALGVLLQMPEAAAQCQMDRLPTQAFLTPVHQRIYEAIRAAGGTGFYQDACQQAASDEDRHQAGRQYIQQILTQADSSLASAITQIAVEPLPLDDDMDCAQYAKTLNASLVRFGLTREIGELRTRLRQTAENDEAHARIAQRLMELQRTKQAWDAQRY